jgi:hypothetical protein
MFKYGLTTEASQTELTAGITGFLTDTAFSYPVACARKSFTHQPYSRRHQNVISDDENMSNSDLYQTTCVQNYRIKFGNPFPGPEFGVAQHCVELIYLFDAFHDHMALVDVDITVREQMQAPILSTFLASMLQQHWISFIVEDRKSETDESDVTVYEKTKTISVENLKTGTEWIQQEERFTLLAADWKGVLQVFKKITGQVLM